MCEVISSTELYDLAFEIAVGKKITVYDAFFIAASMKYNALLATAYRKLFQKAENSILVRSDKA